MLGICNVQVVGRGLSLGGGDSGKQNCLANWAHFPGPVVSRALNQGLGLTSLRVYGLDLFGLGFRISCPGFRRDGLVFDNMLMVVIVIVGGITTCHCDADTAYKFRCAAALWVCMCM